MLNAWIMWWNAESLSQGLSNYWNAPCFSPTPGVLALSEPLSVSLLLAPITWFFESAIPTYNTYLVLSLVLNGVFARRLLVYAGCDPRIASCGGLATILHPLALQNLEAVQLVPMWSILWTLEALLRFKEQPSLALGLSAGLGFAATYYMCLHHALFFGLILLICLGWLIPFRHLRTALPAGALTIGLTLLLLLPGLVPLRMIQAEFSIIRSPQVVRALSASPIDWLTCQETAWFLPLTWLGVEAGQFPLLPGPIRSCLAIGCLPFCMRRYPAVTKLLGLVLATSFVLSFGPNLNIGGWHPWDKLAENFSSIAMVRSPYRFAYFSQLAIGLLATMAVDDLIRRIRQRSPTQSSHLPPPWHITISGSLVTLLVIVLVFEVIPGRTLLTHPPLPQFKEAWIDFLRDKTEPSASLVCLPVARNHSERANERETLWMTYATLHGRPILNGYSGFTPKSWIQLSQSLREDPFSDTSLAGMVDLGANYIVIKKTHPPLQQRVRRLVSEPPDGCTVVFNDERYLILSID